MTSRTHTAPTGDRPAAVEIRNFSGSVALETRDDADAVSVRVEPLDTAAEQLLDQVVIDDSAGDPAGIGPVTVRVLVPERRLFRTPSFAIAVTAPAGTAARLTAGSADAVLRGRWGRVVAKTASGDVEVERCSELDVRTASGDTRVGEVADRASVATASGDVRGGTFGAGVEVSTASGDVSIERAARDTGITTASGDVVVESVAAGSLRIKTVSGDATVGVSAGRRVWLDLSSISGRMGSELDDDPGESAEGESAQISLALRSVSGDLRIRRDALTPPVG